MGMGYPLQLGLHLERFFPTLMILAVLGNPSNVKVSTSYFKPNKTLQHLGNNVRNKARKALPVVGPIRMLLEWHRKPLIPSTHPSASPNQRAHSSQYLSQIAKTKEGPSRDTFTGKHWQGLVWIMYGRFWVLKSCTWFREWVTAVDNSRSWFGART